MSSSSSGILALLEPIKQTYALALSPIHIPVFNGILSPLDFAATVRLCLVMRQLRDMFLKMYLASPGAKGKDAKAVESMSYVKSAATTLVVVYGGEALVGPYLGWPPSFLLSPMVPALYTATQMIIDFLPSSTIPLMSINTELPLSLLDGLTRAYLLCDLIPPGVLSLGGDYFKDSMRTNPWTLCVSSLFIANTGFFLVSLFSMLSPTGYAVSTPPELRAYGWTTTDIWCAPLTTAVFATLTHAQPFWRDLYIWIYQALGLYVFAGSGSPEGLKADELQPWDKQSARAACALMLATMFSVRTIKNFGGELFAVSSSSSTSSAAKSASLIEDDDEKRKLRPRVDGKRVTSRTKAQ